MIDDILIYLLSGVKESLSKCKHIPDYSDKNSSKAMHLCSTNLKPGTTTTFYLNATFTGEYGAECGVGFNIMGNNGDKIYHLDFRINMKRKKDMIVQDARFNGRWEGRKSYKIKHLKYYNDIFLDLTPNFYNVTFNDEVVQPQFDLDLQKLKDYTNVKIDHRGVCFTIDFNNSYMQNNGEPI